MGIRLSSNLVSIIANAAGPGGAVAGSQTAWTLSAGKRAIIRKIHWRNRTGGNCSLLVGFGDRTVAGSLFRQVLPRILTLNGIDGSMAEVDLPIVGNTPEGFQNDATIPTGTIGNILVETDDAPAGIGAGAPLEVTIEVEEG